MAPCAGGTERLAITKVILDRLVGPGLDADQPPLASSPLRADKSPPVTARSTILAYAIAVAGTALALGIRLLLQPISGEAALFLFFVPAAMAASMLGGARPGLTATALGVLAAAWVERSGGRPIDVTALALFVAIGAGVSFRGEWFNRARRRSLENAGELAQREAHLQSILDTIP